MTGRIPTVSLNITGRGVRSHDMPGTARHLPSHVDAVLSKLVVKSLDYRRTKRWGDSEIVSRGAADPKEIKMSWWCVEHANQGGLSPVSIWFAVEFSVVQFIQGHVQIGC